MRVMRLDRNPAAELEKPTVMLTDPRESLISKI